MIRSPKHHRAICLCGIDGSGKTTQILLLMRSLCGRGLKCSYVWFRWTPFISYPFLALCRVLGYTKLKINPRSSSCFSEHLFYRNRAVARLWMWFFTFDICMHYLLRVKIRRGLGYQILCDRFVLDAIVDLIHDTNKYDILGTAIGKFLSDLLKQSMIIVLDVNEYEAFRRKEDIPSIDYLRARRASYLRLAQAIELPIIDGNKKPEEVHQAILDKVMSHDKTFC